MRVYKFYIFFFSPPERICIYIYIDARTHLLRDSKKEEKYKTHYRRRLGSGGGGCFSRLAPAHICYVGLAPFHRVLYYIILCARRRRVAVAAVFDLSLSLSCPRELSRFRFGRMLCDQNGGGEKRLLCGWRFLEWFFWGREETVVDGVV